MNKLLGEPGKAELVAMTSRPVESTPKKKSRPSGFRLGITLPLGTLPEGTILRKIGSAGRPLKLMAGLPGLGALMELSHVLMPIALAVEELPPVIRANVPEEEKAMLFAGNGNGIDVSA